ncbi:hypothetical protein LguiA_008857 [Lonicera macranthoides]
MSTEVKSKISVFFLGRRGSAATRKLAEVGVGRGRNTGGTGGGAEEVAVAEALRA